MKAIELTKKLEREVNLEQNMIIQRQLLALISYVSGFDYADKENLIIIFIHQNQQLIMLLQDGF